MKKIYICPAINLSEAQAAQMIAESFPINGDKTVDGDKALTKDGAWEIWDEE